MLILNAVLMALISAGIFALLVWSVPTQHRVPGYENVRVPRRLRIRVKLMPVDPIRSEDKWT